MRHNQISIKVADPGVRDIIIALLADNGYEGFEEKEEELLAYISEAAFSPEGLSGILEPFGLSHSVHVIENANWNKQWESNFDPVIIDGFCTVRADFHNIKCHTSYEIIITPKMSFGTGHHATTQLMIKTMQHLSLKDKRVLDFGTGTGVLAILASFLGARSTLAIDNDEWSFRNALENIENNRVHGIEVKCGTLEEVAGESFDLILANINRNILLDTMGQLYGGVNPGGELLMSGLLEDDYQVVTERATEEGFVVEQTERESGWIAILCLKHG
jgi:ribosomal protein L11 methyltransferase